MSLSPIISAAELAKIYDHKNLVIVEAGSGGTTRENYQTKQLKKAQYADLNDDLAEIPYDAANGGRHPLPPLKKFVSLLQRLGISKNSHVVVYDDKNGSNAAARLWWMLRAAGIETVQVLDGGLQKAEEAGLPVTSEIFLPENVGTFDPEQWNLPTISIDEVENMTTNPTAKIIDVREKNRYDGLHEPIDKIAGHIPNAVNIPFSDNLDENGYFKKPEDLKKHFQNKVGAYKPENTAVHCGSGVTACHTLLAMAYAGLPLPKLYVGSWSEWSRNNKPIETTNS